MKMKHLPFFACLILSLGCKGIGRAVKTNFTAGEESGISQLASTNQSAPSTGKVWVLQRNLPLLNQVLAAVAILKPKAIFLSDGRDYSVRGKELQHLVDLMSNPEVYWVGRVNPPAGLLVKQSFLPPEIIGLVKRGMPTSSRPHAEGLTHIHVMDPSLISVATLIAMRTGGFLDISQMPPTESSRIIQVGGAFNRSYYKPWTQYQLLGNTQEAMAYANSLATRSALMITSSYNTKAEHLLYAYMRGTKWAQVSTRSWNAFNEADERAATMDMRASIQSQILNLYGGSKPEALIIAASMAVIPYRFVRENLKVLPCAICQTGYFEVSADAEYGNLDHDEWGDAEIPVGRLASYDDDLLSIQSQIGLLYDAGAFAPAREITRADMFYASYGASLLSQEAAALGVSVTSAFGPRNYEEYQGYQLPLDAFFSHADKSKVVSFTGHGNSDYLGTHSLQLNGQRLEVTALNSLPSFWFLFACGTAEYATHFAENPRGTKNLITSLQARLALGSLMSVEVVASASQNEWWFAPYMRNGKPVGEVVMQGHDAAIAYYRRDPGALAAPVGFPGAVDNVIVNQMNAALTDIWLGDPLTRM